MTGWGVPPQAVVPARPTPSLDIVGRRVVDLYRRRAAWLIGPALIVQLVSLPVGLWAGRLVEDAVRRQQQLIVDSIGQHIGTRPEDLALWYTPILLATDLAFRAYLVSIAGATLTALVSTVVVAAVAGALLAGRAPMAGLRDWLRHPVAGLVLAVAGTAVVVLDAIAYWATWRGAVDRVGTDPAAFVLLLLAGFVIGIVSVVVGTWLSVRWSLSLAAAAVDPIGPADALAESTRLVRGRFWAVSVILIAALLAAAVVLAPLVVVAGLVPGVASAVTLHLVQAVAAPIVPVAMTVLLVELRAIDRPAGPVSA